MKQRIYKNFSILVFIYVLFYSYSSYTASFRDCFQWMNSSHGNVFFRRQTDSKAQPRPSRPYLRKLPSFNIPRSSRESKLLKSKGYNEDDYRGVDEIIYYGILGAHIQKAGIDPSRTHIEDFALLAPERLSLFRELAASKKKHLEGGAQLFSKTAAEKTNLADESFNIFSAFEKEALDRIQRRAVTYRWFIQWSHRMTLLASLGDQSPLLDKLLLKDKRWTTHEGSESLSQMSFGAFSINRNSVIASTGLKTLKEEVLDDFPHHIVFYTPNETGFIALNYAEPAGIPIVFLNNTPSAFYTERKPTDGLVLSSIDMANHDIRHYTKGFGKNRWGAGIEAPVSKTEFKNRLIDRIRRLPYEQGYKVHLGFFLLNHEFSAVGGINIQNREDILKFILSKQAPFAGAYRSLLPYHLRSSNRTAVTLYLRETAKALSDAIDEII